MINNRELESTLPSSGICPPNLCYTISVDLPGQDFHWRMARLLVTSLLRTQWNGPIVAFTGTNRPLLDEPHPLVREILIPNSMLNDWDRIIAWKYLALEYLDLTGINKVVFLDCDCIALKPIDTLFFGNWDLYTAPERSSIVESQFNGMLSDREKAQLAHLPGLNSGAFAVRASCYPELMRQWKSLDEHCLAQPACHLLHDQHSWNRLALDTQLRRRNIELTELCYPLLNGVRFNKLAHVKLVHAAGGKPADKLAALYGIWALTHGLESFESVVQA